MAGERDSEERPKANPLQSYMSKNPFAHMAMLRRTRQYNALTREHSDAKEAWSRSFDLLDSDDARRQLLLKHPNTIFAREFLDLAEKSPEDLAAVNSLNTIVLLMSDTEEADEALLLLREHHAERPLVAPILHRLEAMLSPESEKLLRAIVAKNQDPEIQAQARFALAMHLVRRFEADASAENAQQLLSEGTGLLEEMAANQCDVLYGGNTLTDAAREALAAYRQLTIGRPVPDISGEDVYGKRMRLSDYRGKVVLLDFWSSTCAPCMRMKPYENRLRSRMAGKPFVLLGVACDDDRERLKTVVEQKGVSWPCWWAGRANDDSISTHWTVRRWPTLYLIDKGGILRTRFDGFPGEERLDRAVDEMFDE